MKDFLLIISLIITSYILGSNIGVYDLIISLIFGISFITLILVLIGIVKTVFVNAKYIDDIIKD